MRPSLHILTVILGLSLGTSPALATPPDPEAFAPLHTLVGAWQGTGSDGKPIKASYRFTSGGTSLMETLEHDGKPEMTTMYYLDGNRLMLTHYCALNNQPRLRAGEATPAGKTLSFSFVDATNLARPTDLHMHHLTLEFTDHDHFTAVWVSMEDNKEMPHTFAFERMK